jgi:predicted TIM-barrel fold metal-dependent hydrolase
MVLKMEKIAWPSKREIPELGHPLPAGTVVISADSHVMEGENIWRDRLPARFVDRAPKFWRDENGFHLEFEGMNLALTNEHAMDINRLSEGRPGMYDQEERIKDIDAEGVAKEVLFPQRTLSLVQLADQELRGACNRAYNEFLSDYCAKYPTRFYGVGVLNWWEPEAARDNIQAIKALDLPAMEIPSAPRDVKYNDPALEPMWTAIEESGIPLSMHVGEMFQTVGMGSLGTRVLSSFQPFRQLFGLLTFSGVLEHHPEMKVVFTEGGISWVPSALFEADKIHRDYETELNPKLAYPPSHYWFQNCYATFQEDPRGLEQLDYIGWDRVMWASDYPHPESTLGYTRQAVWDVFNATTVEKAQAIVGGTAATLWNLT